MPQTECGLRVDAIEALLGDSPATANDQLRDAVSVLDDRITQGRQAADTQPELIPALDLADRVLALWRDAVTALDNEDQAAADAAMAQAAAEIDTARAMAGGAESC